MQRSHDVALATDLYQLTMGAAYSALHMEGEATFSLFVRALPATRAYLVVAGLEDALDRLEALRFDDDALDYLRRTGQIRSDFLDRLRDLRFSGQARAVPEGRVVFADEPLLEITAPILEAQLAETVVINAMHYATLIASKAARCVQAAAGRALVEFGLRRTSSIEAGVIAARSAYLAGFAGTSNLLAGERLQIPVSGTVAHSFIQAFPNEREALYSFARTFPGPATLLIDTYDTIRGARHAVEVAARVAEEGGRVGAVRIDSGDLAALAFAVRDILDEARLQDVRIIASGGLDEREIARLVAAGAPIDAFGVGTSLGTSSDAPYLDMIYKLVEYEGEPRLKLSSGKRTLAGPKQVWRSSDAGGRYLRDLIAHRDEPAPGEGWEPLLQTVMADGRVLDRPSLDEIRRRHQADVRRLPDALRSIEPRAEFPVTVSPRLARMQEEAAARIASREGLGSDGPGETGERRV